MISEAPSEAVKYTSIILVCYVIGMVLLLLHFMKQKHGQVSDKDSCQKFVFDHLPPLLVDVVAKKFKIRVFELVRNFVLVLCLQFFILSR